MSGEVWVRPDEAAVWLGSTEDTVRQLAKRRGWRRRRSGRAVWYDLDDVETAREASTAGRPPGRGVSG